MWCWERMEGIIWTDLVRNAEILQKGKRGQNYSTRNEKKKANSIGQILHGNCLLKSIVQRKIEGRI